MVERATGEEVRIHEVIRKDFSSRLAFEARFGRAR